MKRVVTAAMALSMLAGSVAMADSARQRRDDRTRHDQLSERHHSKDRDHEDRGRYGHQDWRDGRRDDDQRWDHRRDGRDDDNRWDDDRDRHDRDHGWDHGWDHRRDWRDDHRYDQGRRYWMGHYHRPWGYTPRSWRRGERLPGAYYATPYRIYDYERCGLRRPPYGHHWVRVDHDAILAVIATGFVLDVVFDAFS